MEVLGLKRANCKSCHKCIRVCPVKSIEFSGQQAKIIGDECILCGQCVVTCPQNAKVVRSDLPQVKAAIAAGQRVVASVAPSFIVDFPVEGIEELAVLLRKLGFAGAEETAMGAYLVKSEYGPRTSSFPPAALRRCGWYRNIIPTWFPVWRR